MIRANSKAKETRPHTAGLVFSGLSLGDFPMKDLYCEASENEPVLAEILEDVDHNHILLYRQIGKRRSGVVATLIGTVRFPTNTLLVAVEKPIPTV